MSTRSRASTNHYGRACATKAGNWASRRPEELAEALRVIVEHLTPIRFHDLRHTHTSLLVTAGTPIKVVSERLGHAHPGFTMHTYQHLLPGMGATAAHHFAALLASRWTSTGSEPHRFSELERGPVDGPVDPRRRPRRTKARRPLRFRAFVSVAGAGFEPATFGL